MDITFYNTLTNASEKFQSLVPNKVTMYGCGPTVYDYAHIGNFRSFLFSDVLRRFLEVAGYEVDQVINITDVGHMTDDHLADGGGEDKMDVAAKKLKAAKKAGTVAEGAVENPDDPYQIADYYTRAFLEDARRLGMLVADEYPRRVLHATQNIDAMQDVIQKLLDRGHAYVAGDGVVYYSVESFDRYGQLSGNTLDQLRTGSGGRVLDTDQANKRHPADFLLWKPDESHVMKWDSPWGTGYPGWHIECSAMAMKVLGETIDIHTGGEDLIFPHHECEVAQSCGATGNDAFARHWMHVRFLLVNDKKMSKSQGNFYTVRDLVEGRATGQPVHPSVLRFELIRSHYRANCNFTAKGLADSTGNVVKLSRFARDVEAAAGGVAEDVDATHPILNQFLTALADDLNVAGALAIVLPWINKKAKKPQEALGVCRKINHVLNVMPLQSSVPVGDLESMLVGDIPPEVIAACAGMDQARAEKDYDAADKLRGELLEDGWQVQTTKDGTVVQMRLPHLLQPVIRV
jgi:cysteinyl-tRNA synthetase